MRAIKLKKTKLYEFGIEVISRRVDPEDAERIRKRIDEEWEFLQKERPELRQIGNRALFQNIVVATAIYRALKAHNEERSKEVFEEIYLGFTRDDIERSFAKRRLFKNLYKHKRIASFIVSSMEKLKEKEGWKGRKVESDAFLSLDITQCGAHRFLSRLGDGEMCEILCEGDNVIAGYMEHLEFKREKMISRGDDVCSFRYFKS
jgi:hypothetical protein